MAKAENTSSNSSKQIFTAAVVKDFPPQYALNKDGKPVGFAIDIMNEIASSAGFQVKYVITKDWNEAEKVLLSGEADLIPNFGITRERDLIFDFTSPIETFPISIFVRRNYDEIKGKKDLPGHKVAAVKANAAVDLLKEIKGVNPMIFNSPHEALFALLSGNIDAFVFPQPAAVLMAREIGLEERIITVGPPLAEIKRAMAVRDGNKVMLERLNKAINEFIGTPEYRKIYLKWYGKPNPYWTPTRILLLMSILVLITVLSMAFWRYRTLLNLNRALDKHMVELKKSEEALREGEERLRVIVETSQAGILLVDSEGKFTFANQRMAEMFGCTLPELIGTSYPDHLHSSEKAMGEKRMRQLMAGEVDHVSTERHYVRKDGSDFWGYLSGRRLVGPDGKLAALVGVIADITERKKTEERIERQIERMTALRSIDMAISSTLDLRLTLHILLGQVTTQLKADAADILLLDPHTMFLNFAAGTGFRTKAVERTHIRLGQGLAGQAAMQYKTISMPNIGDRGSALTAALKDDGFKAYFAVPLIAKGDIKGILEIFHRAPLEPDNEWISFLELLGGQAAIAVDNASLFDTLQRSHAELITAYDTTIEGWSRALDIRDKETEGHSERVTDMAVRMAKAMGIREDELMHIRRGALLHDIGKLGVPDSILLKPGKLTDEEWIIMKKHPEISFEVLSPIPFLRPAIDIPYCHHEKWDGTGYPRGLRGEQIPLAARIFALVDVWDALRSDRPYRSAWPEERVMEHIKSLSGTHFDPKVVKVFLETEALNN